MGFNLQGPYQITKSMIPTNIIYHLWGLSLLITSWIFCSSILQQKALGYIAMYYKHLPMEFALEHSDASFDNHIIRIFYTRKQCFNQNKGSVMFCKCEPYIRSYVEMLTCMMHKYLIRIQLWQLKMSKNTLNWVKNWLYVADVSGF